MQSYRTLINRSERIIDVHEVHERMNRTWILIVLVASFFLLPLFLQLHRVGLFLWMSIFLALIAWIFVSLPQDSMYIITTEHLIKVRKNTHSVLWRIPLRDITDARRLRSHIRISIPKKVYLIYNGATNPGLLESLKNETSSHEFS